MILEPPESVRKLQMALQAKAKGAPSYRFYLLYYKLYRKDVLKYVSLSQISSGWRGTTNRVMLSPDVGRLEIAVVTSDRVLPIARVT